MEQPLCNWTPQLIVELIKGVIWPIVVIIIGFRFRTRIGETFKEFFSKNNLSSFKASATGVEAQFNAITKQTSKATENSNNSSNMPENMSLEAINKRHTESSTLMSEESFKSIKAHLSALQLEDKEQIELLSKEVAIQHTERIYTYINKAIFRSQFDLLNRMKSSELYISNLDLENHFNEIRKAAGEGLLSWDWIKYISYLVSSNLIISNADGYQLTDLGKSYLEFMFRNPSLIHELTSL